MKTIYTTVFFLLSTASFAQSFKYDCKLLTDIRVTENIVVTAKKMTVLTEVFGGKILKGVFDNTGVKGGNGKMKDRLSFVKNYQESTELNDEIAEFLLTPDMLTGGSRLRNGSMGGFVSFAGHGYSWETFICFKK